MENYYEHLLAPDGNQEFAKYIIGMLDDLNYGLVRRKNEDGTVKVLSFSPREVLHGSNLLANLILEERDALFIFPRDQSRDPLIKGIISDLNQQKNPGTSPNVVKISGFVRHPGEYPLTENMDLNDLIIASGGLIDASYTLTAELTRLGVEQGKYAVVEHMEIIDLHRDQNASPEPIILRPSDHLFVKKIPYWAESRTIILAGEFMFPGEYRIKRGETIREVVKRAGGLTFDAFVEGAIFTRDHIRKKETIQRQEFIDRLENILAYENIEKNAGGESSSEQSRALLSRLKSSTSTGRLVINLKEQLNSDLDKSIIALDGDKLLVPLKPQEVTVGGEVQFPTSHLYYKELNLNDFIERSGGFTERADMDRVALIKVDGQVLTKSSSKWFSQKNSLFKVETGDMIIVPVKIELPSKFLKNLSFSTQIIYQMAIAAAAINSF